MTLFRQTFDFFDLNFTFDFQSLFLLDLMPYITAAGYQPGEIHDVLSTSEQELCYQSHVFLYSQISTWSFNLVYQRRVDGRSSIGTIFRFLIFLFNFSNFDFTGALIKTGEKTFFAKLDGPENFGRLWLVYPDKNKTKNTKVDEPLIFPPVLIRPLWYIKNRILTKVSITETKMNS